MFKVIGYYTPNYEKYAVKLIESCEKFNLLYEIVPKDSCGSWLANVNYKPTFIKMMIQELNCDVVYVDCDAVFMQYPTLFDNFTGDFGVHLYRKRQIASGTIYVKNNTAGIGILDSWINRCIEKPKQNDQTSLQDVLVSYVNLPSEYCHIFDKSRGVPVIKHMQASRKERHAEH